MNIYLAPLEGITGNVFRTGLHNHFGGVDKFFTPFIAPNAKGVLNHKALRDILPENNQGQRLVPQILTNDADGFLLMCRTLEGYGYKEINLNLGCPSATVVSKGRGSGFLAYPDKLDSFLDKIFNSHYEISIKTRIGKESAAEFDRILDIYNKYPLKELIIHPRTREDMYGNTPDWEAFSYAVKNSRAKLCYNGDIFQMEDFIRFKNTFPEVESVMIGRGALINPCLCAWIKGEGEPQKEEIKAFFKEILCQYQKILFGERPVLFKMKELAIYMEKGFDNTEKIVKKIKKAKSLEELEVAVDALFSEYPPKSGKISI